MAFTTHEAGTMVGGSCLLLLYLAVMGYAAWRCVRRREWRQSFLHRIRSRRSPLSRLLAAVGFKGCEKGEEEEEDAERQIRSYAGACVAEHIVWNVKQLGACLAFAAGINVGWMILKIGTGAPRWYGPLDDMLALIIFALGLVIVARPQLVSARSIPSWYSLFMAIWCLCLWSAETPSACMYHTLVLLYCRFLSSVAAMRPWMVACWQAVCSACSCYRVVVIYQNVQSDISMSMLLAFEICGSFTIVFFTYQATKSKYEAAYQTVKVATMEGGCSAMERLLELMCDVVVELGDDLRLKKHAPKFSAIVTVGGSNRSLKGSQLQEFMPLPEDKRRLEEHLLPERCTSGAACPHGMPPGALHCKLRDALGNQMDVELFYVHFTYCGERSFLIGIREQADWGIPELPTFANDKTAKMRKKRRATTTSPRGTPPAAIGRGVDEEDAEDADRASASDGAGSAMCTSSGRNQNQFTTKRAVLLSLIRTMESWVPEDEGGACCPFHDAVAAAKEGITMMEGFSCARLFHGKGNMQCQACRVLLTYKVTAQPQDGANAAAGSSGRVCRLCGSDRLLPFSPKNPAHRPPQLGDARQPGDAGTRVNL